MTRIPGFSLDIAASRFAILSTGIVRLLCIVRDGNGAGIYGRGDVDSRQEVHKLKLCKEPSADATHLQKRKDSEGGSALIAAKEQSTDGIDLRVYASPVEAAADT
jgi:hypothetical protein